MELDVLLDPKNLSTIELALNFAIISLSMYNVKESIRKTFNFIAKFDFDNIHD
jgi:hypothetical protein